VVDDGSHGQKDRNPPAEEMLPDEGLRAPA
jgi:hypothetical protein